MSVQTTHTNLPAPSGFGIAEQISGWAPGPVTAVDPIDPRPAAALAATLGIDAPAAGILPPLWHWLYFLDWPTANELGEDGHPASGHFLPPLTQRTRMFAGGRLEQRRPLAMGVETLRSTTLVRTDIKQGRTGELLFLVLRHELRQEDVLCVVEEQDIVYRSGPVSRPAPTGPGAQATDEPCTPDAVLRPTATMLFRFSALTANAHRIHYDADYARDVEGYQSLVIHGPLQILLMLQTGAGTRPGEQLARARYRLSSPALLGEQLLVTTKAEDHSVDVEIATSPGAPASASARLTFL